MKYWFLYLSVLLAACTASSTMSNNPVPKAPVFYQITKDRDSSKMLLGLITMPDIIEDTAFAWYKQNLQYYRPNNAVINQLKSKGSQLDLVIFLGTWCEDTHQILPKYFTSIQQSGFSPNQLTLVAVNRQKVAVSNLHRAFGVTHVPTLIAIKNGREIGRIEEFGPTGLPDEAFEQLLNKVP